MQQHPRPRGEVPRGSIIDKHQVVAGFVIFRRTSDGIKYLLLYKRGTYWNFPKGHFEQGENSFATAFRETEEETGIRPAELKVIPGFKAYQRFTFRSGQERVHDKVILFLAETKQPNVRIAPREHSGFGWFLYQDALQVVGKKYQATKNVLKQANDYLHHKGPRRGQPHPQRQHANVPGSREARGAPQGGPGGRDYPQAK
jgi:8-oxo-dGTP pyrophosphatase MutT (NUDIX family)